MNEQTLEQLLEEAERIPPAAPWSDLPLSVFNAAVFLAQVSRIAHPAAIFPLWSICVQSAKSGNPQAGEAYNLITRLAISTDMRPWSLHYEDGMPVEPADLEPADSALKSARVALLDMFATFQPTDANEADVRLLSGVSKATTTAQEAAIVLRSALGHEPDNEYDDNNPPSDIHEELRKHIEAVKAGRGLAITMTTSLRVVDALERVGSTFNGPDVIKLEALQDIGSASVTITPALVGDEVSTEPVTMPRAKIVVKKHAEGRGFMRGEGQQIRVEFGEVVVAIDLGEPIDDEHQARQRELIAALNERNEQAGLARCVVCGKPFIRTRRGSLYCSTKCGNRMRQRRMVERRRTSNAEPIPVS